MIAEYSLGNFLRKWHVLMDIIAVMIASMIGMMQPRKWKMMNKIVMNIFENRSATYSPCMQYRYTLQIIWDESLPLCAFVGLNPSTATEFQDDPTIRRCKKFARDWGCGGLLMLNLFAWRSTDPDAMKRTSDPVGPENTLGHIYQHLQQVTGPRIAAWGKHGHHMGRHKLAMAAQCRFSYLRLNGDGTPAHPLYMPGNLRPIPWEPTK